MISLPCIKVHLCNQPAWRLTTIRLPNPLDKHCNSLRPNTLPTEAVLSPNLLDSSTLAEQTSSPGSPLLGRRSAQPNILTPLCPWAGVTGGRPDCALPYRHGSTRGCK